MPPMPAQQFGVFYFGEVALVWCQVSIIDTTFNAYGVTLDLANCAGTRAGFDGTYNGLGFTGDDVGTDDVFIFIVFNADYTLGGEAKK